MFRQLDPEQLEALMVKPYCCQFQKLCMGRQAPAAPFFIGVNQSAGLKKGLANNKQVNTDDH